MSDLSAVRIHITGVVQGVGFRPFVYGLATRLLLKGWVRNTSAGVDIEVEGSPSSIDAFISALKVEAPPLASIDQFTVEASTANGYTRFEIIHSEDISEAFQPISPDVSICADCLDELFNPVDRRYFYPFINCTNCGPRFTIIKDVPYDRPKTTMASFGMCPDCSLEYNHPLDRRFHAQPIACPRCGPHVWLEPSSESTNLNKKVDRESFESDTKPDQINVFKEAQKLLSSGKILAIKGLGGFHLACDATNSSAVAILRKRKLRVDKPYALMMPDIATIQTHCFVSDQEQELLESRERPIVILKRRQTSSISRLVAPGQETIGIMLPYTPLHYLLFADAESSEISNDRTGLPPTALVMTSGNLSEEPIATDNNEARERLANLADVFLMHNRPIRTRCDDSVMRVMNSPKILMPIRRSRGYAPFPVHLPWDVPSILAVGAELKNTFCITREHYAFLSHHIGDLENLETLQSFEDGINHFEQLFRINPQALAYDLHPDYLATRYTLDRMERENLPAIGVQHHHAHIASCMVENGLSGDIQVIGVAFDGTGFGLDGAIWGGEFLVCDYAGFRRVAHLEYVPLPGGDRAVREPWRMALAWLYQAGIEWDRKIPPVEFAQNLKIHGKPNRLDVLHHQLQTGLNAPPTSSIGRLFDAVAALIGLRQEANYEAQAAIELEAIIDPNESQNYAFEISVPELFKDNHPDKPLIKISPKPVLIGIVHDWLNQAPKSFIAAGFHHAVSEMVASVALSIREYNGLNNIALSGGVWQNMVLLEQTCNLLREHGFNILLHQKVPCNDGGLALGQAVVAAHSLR